MHAGGSWEHGLAGAKVVAMSKENQECMYKSFAASLLGDSVVVGVDELRKGLVDHVLVNRAAFEGYACSESGLDGWAQHMVQVRTVHTGRLGSLTMVATGWHGGG